MPVVRLFLWKGGERERERRVLADRTRFLYGMMYDRLQEVRVFDIGWLLCIVLSCLQVVDSQLRARGNEYLMPGARLLRAVVRVSRCLFRQLGAIEKALFSSHRGLSNESKAIFFFQRFPTIKGTKTQVAKSFSCASVNVGVREFEISCGKKT